MSILLGLHAKEWFSKKMEKYFEKSESIKVEVSELEHFLLVPEDTDVSITSPKTPGGRSKFVLRDTPRGKGAGRGVEVADAARFAEAAREVRRREAASATRRRATRPAQWKMRPLRRSHQGRRRQ